MIVIGCPKDGIIEAAALRADECTPVPDPLIPLIVPAIPDQPLTEAELERLDTFLAACKGGKAMNIEQLDGFFAALIVGPDLLPPQVRNG